LLSVKHRSRHDQPIATALLLLASLTSAACDDRDTTSMLPRAGSGGVGAGGAAGGSGGTSGTGTGGGATVLDAGTDASGDAASPASECVVGTLEAYCNRRECPALADAREALRDTGVPYIRTIIQRPCAAPNGGARVAVTAQFLQWSLTYIYDAATEQLVGVIQLTAKHRVATPADWTQGDDVIIAGSVSNDEAKTIYPQGWKEPKPYLRIVPQPK
jgi:hypothetical protein